jgi:osmotically-inducible protein OsmY
MKHLLLMSFLICLCFQVACTRGTESTQAAREPRMTDSELKNKIENSINSDAQLRAANLSVSADAVRNSATLTGTVDSEAMRSRAVLMARAAQPGLTVEDKIDVKPRELTRSDYTPEMARTEAEKARTRNETVGTGIDDAWIHSKIVAKLITNRETPERKINVDVTNNVVTLRGTVDTLAAKEEAERIAKETDGVKTVRNQLKVAVSR